MINQKKLSKTLIFGCGILFWTYAAPVKAQFETRIPIGNISPKRPPSSRPPSSRPPSSRPPKPITVTVTKTIIKQPSILTVDTEPGATVLLEPQKPSQKKIKPRTADQAGVVVFNDLPVGKYKITATKTDYEPLKDKDIEISPQTAHGVDMDLELITRDLMIETNINKGEVRYARANLKNKKADGSLVLEETGGYCIEPIKDKKAFIKGLKNGYYSIDIQPSKDNIEYNPILTAIEVSDKIAEDSNESQDGWLDFKVDLERKISEVTFDASAWTSDAWDKPAGWKLNNLMKTDGLDGIALPRDNSYRYYTDFEMRSDVRLLNADTVGFVVRAEEDGKSYYLIQLSGAKARERHFIKAYRVENDKKEEFFSLSLDGFAKTLAEKNFRVIIKVKKNQFKVDIEDSGGNRQPVGEFSDQYETFKKGATGIAGSKNSNFEILNFWVCNQKCNF